MLRNYDFVGYANMTVVNVSKLSRLPKCVRSDFLTAQLNKPDKG